MKLLCTHCGFVMYRKPVIHNYLEYCDDKCLDEHLTIKAMLANSGRVVELPLEVSYAHPTLSLAKEGEKK